MSKLENGHNLLKNQWLTQVAQGAQPNIPPRACARVVGVSVQPKKESRYEHLETLEQPLKNQQFVQDVQGDHDTALRANVQDVQGDHDRRLERENGYSEQEPPEWWDTVDKSF